jgi:hypothetical protein
VAVAAALGGSAKAGPMPSADMSAAASRARRGYGAARRCRRLCRREGSAPRPGRPACRKCCAVMRLALGQLQGDRQTFGVDEGVDLRRQPAARATHATGSIAFFWASAAC